MSTRLDTELSVVWSRPQSPRPAAARRPKSAARLPQNGNPSERNAQ